MHVETPMMRQNDVAASGIDEVTIAHKLVIELLAHQFAFPVRWIETQDKLFEKDKPISRFVELGPSKILSGMAKRTQESKYADKDTFHRAKRQYLSGVSELKDIYYDYEDPGTKDATGSKNDALPSVAIQPLQSKVEQLKLVEDLVESPSMTAILRESVPDVPVLAIDIIRSLIGHKLKKTLEDVPVGRSIKEISGGKSTLQNELVGDLDAEFGLIPDGVEDLPLSALGEALSPSFSGSLGKRAAGLVARLISSKLPAGFNQAAIRSYLEQTWGLGSSRQSSVLLFAVTAEPSSRFASVEIAKEWLDANLKRYASSCGLALSQPSQQKAVSSTSSAISSEEFNAIKEEQRKFLTNQFAVLAKHLDIDSSNHTKVTKLEASIREMEERLETWGSEFSDDFHLGIQPLFDAQKIRRYRSWWNWARSDVLKLYHDANMGINPLKSEEQASEITLKLNNRLDGSIKDIIANFTRDQESNDERASLNQKLRSSINFESADEPPVFKYTCILTKPETSISAEGQIEYKEVIRETDSGAKSYPQLLTHSSKNDDVPYVHIRTRSSTAQWVLDTRKTDRLMATFGSASDSGLTFSGKTILVTGAGPGSIGSEVIKGLLMGGAKVIVTTSRSPASTATFFQNIYKKNCSRGSELVLLPFNQGSARDCETMINHIYAESGMNTNVDAIIPFAAISEVGMEIDDIGARSELAHRLMLTNVFRILGAIVSNKRRCRIETRPTQVILPLSPNTGTFGGDGLYSASKLGLESLLNRFSSESWSDYLTICGALIGWTRGTGLMHGNDNVAPIIESKGALTFSQPEMALNIMALLSTEIAQMCETEAILADLNGGLDMIPGLSQIMATTRSQLSLKALIQKTILKENARQAEFLDHGNQDSNMSEGIKKNKVSRISPKIGFPSLPDYHRDLAPLHDLQGMVDLSSTIVVVGFSELGPWGSARTRWEMESSGALSSAGYAEMAWIMNLIKHVDTEIKGLHYCGWVDVTTGEPIDDSHIQTKYGAYILEHSGVRIIESGFAGGYDPAKKEYLQEIAVEEDLAEFETSRSTAEALKLRLGDSVSIRHSTTSEEFKVQIKRGAHILVPKAMPADCAVAGQIPSGWNPVKYGIPEDMVHQADPVTLYSLCCAAEALYSAGIIDSLELFKYIHVSEIGNILGGCIGGSTKTRNMYKDQYLDKPVQSDIIQETFLNASATWINMLLLGASGPIKTPNGTCATGVESLEIGCESILANKTKFCLVGGVDDLQEEEAHGFAKIKATVNTNAEFAKGRLPYEMSRPTTESRSGFVEAQGCGLQLICTAELALEMGLPIYAIIAETTMSADKISRSLPAPGQGVLTFARESARASKSPLLSLKYRRQQMQACIADIEEWRSSHMNLSFINAEADARIRAVRKMFGNDFRSQDPEISPIRASLAVFGLDINDIGIVSLHATSTGANDKNEPDVVNRQMTALGRTPGNPLIAICQKALTGHPKGAAASWMMNGCLQALETGIVPGNRNADSIDERLRKFQHLVFPTESIQTREVKAFLLNSFGFGQKGAQMIGIAPKYLFATLNRDEFQRYSSKVTKRKRLATRSWIKAVNTNTLFKARSSPPYAAQDESAVLMDPLARIPIDADDSDLKFDSSNLHPSPPRNRTLSFRRIRPTPNPKPRSLSSLSSTSSASPSPPRSRQTPPRPGPKPASLSMAVPSTATETVNVGVDVEDMNTFTSHENEIFVQRNYTATETAQCTTNLNPREAFAANWTAKEAVFKSLGIKSKGAAAPMKDIEILRDGESVRVLLHGDALAAARTNSICNIQVNMSTNNDTALAVAIAKRGTGELTYIRSVE